MHSRITLVLFLVTLITFTAWSQTDFHGIAPVMKERQPCLTTEDRENIKKILEESRSELGMPDRSDFRTHQDEILFDVPIRQGANYDDSGYFGISNFVDLNTSYPDQITDYNCGARSYDLNDGYNHQGTDYFSWPFAWSKMDNNQVEIIAIAPGTIIYKQGSNQDKSCSFNGSQWNAVYVEHDDGSIAWYGHLKTNSLTAKTVGSRVETGEFLGIMGSSGISTGPHLHLEIYDNQGNLIDPYVGQCNYTTDRSWWTEQEPYNAPQLNTVMTHAVEPQFGCYEEELLDRNAYYQPGQTIFFATYFRDQAENDPSTQRIIDPNGDTWAE